jgi:hypothetical protein
VRTEKFHPAEAGEFTYGTYQTFALPMWLGAQQNRNPTFSATFCGVKINANKTWQKSLTRKLGML